MYGYTSTVDVATAPSAGLAGALVVAAAGTLQPSKVVPQQEVPPGVDLMIPLYWQVRAGLLVACEGVGAGDCGSEMVVPCVCRWGRRGFHFQVVL